MTVDQGWTRWAGRPERTVLAIGNFDGVHRGHQHIMRGVAERARLLDGQAWAMTFHPHPAAVLRGLEPHLLCSLDERCRRLIAAGAGNVVVVPFTRDLSEMTPEDFILRVLVERFALREAHIGFNFHFGRDARGDGPLLAAYGERLGFGVRVVEPVEFEGAPVSSTRVREAIRAGDVRLAARLLDRPYTLSGPVVLGHRRGRTLGFPTANLQPDQTLVPAPGVYACRVTGAGPAPLAGALSIGRNPTFGDVSLAVEVHLLDFAGDLYGRTITLDLVERLRGEEKFTDVETLKSRIREDIARVREIIAREEQGIGVAEPAAGVGSTPR